MEFLNKISGDRMGLSLISRLDHASLLLTALSRQHRSPSEGKRGRVIDYYHGELFMTRKNQELDIQDDTKDPLATIFGSCGGIMKIKNNKIDTEYQSAGVLGDWEAHSRRAYSRECQNLKVNQGVWNFAVNPAEIYLIKRGEWYLPLWLTMEVIYQNPHENPLTPCLPTTESVKAW